MRLSAGEICLARAERVARGRPPTHPERIVLFIVWAGTPPAPTTSG
jgi:hypothetical protein